MDPILNPFSPGAGSPPPELVGRDVVLDQARILCARIKQGRAQQSIILTGLRGVGKTVLLNEIKRIAEKANYRTVYVEAYEEKRLGPLLVPYLKQVLFELDLIAGAGDKVKRGLAVLRSFIGTLKVTVGNFGVDIEPARGIADSGDLEVDLPTLLIAVAEAAAERKTAVALLIDEIQFFDGQELGALIMAMHRIQQQQLPLILVGAGLPIVPALAGNAKSYAERLFSFPDIGAFSFEDAAKALVDPAAAEGVIFDAAAIDRIYAVTKGYPYFVQEWAYQAWNTATASPINADTVDKATPAAVVRLDKNFFRVRFDRLTPREKMTLRTIANLGPGPYRTGEVAQALGVKVTSFMSTRAKLIAKGMVYSPAHGDLAFTVPLFDEFMKRVMP